MWATLEQSEIYFYDFDDEAFMRKASSLKFLTNFITADNYDFAESMKIVGNF